MRAISPAIVILLSVLLLGSMPVDLREGGERDRHETPALVVGIMVDQMRPDFVYRYWDKLGDDGFKRLLGEGFEFTNARFDYKLTATGAGHAGVYTGTTPSVHGAMGNSWYVRDLDQTINVIEVPGYEGVGSPPDYDGSKAPSNLLTTTFGDELRLHTNNRSKVVGISRKDRSAILMAGHTGDAYWYEASSGNFVTSTYYRDELPEWVQAFNDRGLVAELLSEPWETMLPIEEYSASIDDENPYERRFEGQEAAVFPHDLPTLVEEHGHDPGLLSYTPFGDELLLELAIAAIEGEELGGGEAPDLLAVSFSAIDGVGHMFGPASVEVQDAYLRLDGYIARLLDYLDEEFGTENFLIFLTSDHGGPHVPEYLVDQGIPGGRFDMEAAMDALSDHLTETYGEDLLLESSNFDIFLDHGYIDRNGLGHAEVQSDVARFMLSLDGVGGALTHETLSNNEFTRGIRGLVQAGFHQKRSGDVVFWLEPQTLRGPRTAGTDHNSPWMYDLHAPMYWYGWNVPAGRSAHPVYISDIASTVATFLNAPFPSGNTGHPMNDRMR